MQYERDEIAWRRATIEKKLIDILFREDIPLDIVDSRTGLIIVPAGKPITLTMIKQMVSAREYIDMDPSPIRNKIVEILRSY